MDESLTDALVELMLKGKKIDRNFTSITYREACQALFDKFRIQLNASVAARNFVIN